MDMKPRTTYICVQPYKANDAYENRPEFVKIRDLLLQSKNLNHILLLEDDVEATVHKFSLDDSYWNGRIFVTHFAVDSTLKEKPSQKTLRFQRSFVQPYGSTRKISFKALSERIEEQFPGDKYVFWGAELHMMHGHIIGGSVQSAHNRLKLPGKRIEEDACWKDFEGYR